MSADQWQQSLRVLYGTADRLEAAARGVPEPAPLPVVEAAVPERVTVAEPAGRSVTRTVVSAAVHSALTVGVLLGDGSVRFIRDTADPRVPADMASRAGGEVAALD